MRISVILLAIMLTLPCQSSLSSEPSQRAPRRRSMVLVISDALRPDVLGCYGGQAATPNIDRLAENGMLFEWAFSNATWTVPSSASIFTGSYPNAFPYEVLVMGGRERTICRIPQQAVPVWQDLAAMGYELAYYLENGIVTHTGALHGMQNALKSRGIGSEDMEKIDEMLGEETYRHKRRYYPVLDYLLGTPRGQPFFLLVWFLDPHAPYSPPRAEEEDISLRYSGLPKGIDYYRNLKSIDLRDLEAGLSDTEVRLLRELYMDEVECIDGRVGNITRALEVVGRLDDTYFIFTSDHGEAFGEHGRMCHGSPGFYDEVVHVPLILSGPGIAKGAAIATAVSHVQLMPTIRSLLRLGPGGDLTGESLLDPTQVSDGRSPPLYFANDSDTCYAVVDGDWKLMLNGSDHRLFNLADDPAELTDVYDRFPEVAARLSDMAAPITAANREQREAFEMLLANEAGQETEIQEIKKALRSLGYLR